MTFCCTMSLPCKVSFFYALFVTTMKRSLFLIPLSIMAFFACKSLNQPEQYDPVDPLQSVFTGVWSGEEVVFTNNSALDVYYVAFPVRILPLVTFTATTNPRFTSKISAYSTARFRRDYFSARNPDTLFVSWWYLGTKFNDSLYNPDSALFA